MSEESTRRHTRGKQPASYRFEDQFAFLNEEDDSSASVAHSSDAQEESASDSDGFVPDGQDEEPDEELDDEDESDDEGGGAKDVDDESDFSDGYATPSQTTAQDFSLMEVSPTPDKPAPATRRRRRKQDATKSPKGTPKKGKLAIRNADGDQIRTRGVAEFTKAGGQELRLKDLFGPENHDLKPILASRNYWYSQETFPLRQPDALRWSFFESDGARDKEVATMRSWYTEKGKYAFMKGQKTRELSFEEAKPYLATSELDSLNVLWGALDDPQFNTLKKGSHISISEPWKKSKDRLGWLFNLGSRIYEAQWAASEEDSTQYLAVSVEQKPPVQQSNLMETPKAPAFNATEPYSTSLQLWSFEGTDDGRLDTSRQPRLALVICTDWGALKQFRWCPYEAINKQGCSYGESNHIGLLAGIWSDGHVRILDVFLPKRDSSAASTTYLHYSQAGIDISFPECVPTCLHWLSGISLVVGTSAGTVAIWTLSRPGTFASSPQVPRPWFYQQLADTFILTIASGWPSQPHLLSISVADGFARLIDMRNPHADATNSIRGRTLCLSQVWHEQTQTFVMPDEQYMVKHNPIRRYYHNLYSMRLEATVTRVAASPVHPGVLAGSVDGSVETTNPVLRIANYKVIPWQQRWFAHEWRRPLDQLVVKPKRFDTEMANPLANPDEEMAENVPAPQHADLLIETDLMTSSNSQSGQVPQDVLSKPLVRFTEGYKAYQPGIQHSYLSKKPTNPEVGKGITIFEEQSAVTALAWNPNLKFGTWAVAGMGSGLLRVEDIGV